eukprot:COSAG06_NODE_2653_length_6493_cov_24.617870_9_plen_168_part_01
MMGADARVAVQDFIQVNVRAQSDVVVLHPPARTHATYAKQASGRWLGRFATQLGEAQHKKAQLCNEFRQQNAVEARTLPRIQAHQDQPYQPPHHLKQQHTHTHTHTTVSHHRQPRVADRPYRCNRLYVVYARARAARGGGCDTLNNWRRIGYSARGGGCDTHWAILAL